MTKRIAMQAVVNGNITDEIIEFFADELTKMDAANAKRREKNAAKSDVRAEYVAKAVGFLGKDFKSATDIATEMIAAGIQHPTEGKVITPQWVSNLMKDAIANGDAVKDPKAIKEPGKAAKVGYKLA